MKHKLIFAIVTILVLIVAGAVFFGFRTNKELPKKKIKVGAQEFVVEVADNAITRASGLSGREKLGDNEGMFFIFNSPGDYGFWMKGMKFPIDIVWINGNKVVDVTENMQPEQKKSVFYLTIYHSKEYADRVLEINAGLVTKYGLKAGDLVRFENKEE